MTRNVGDETRIRFWGTRGGIAVAGADVVRYGGDTACVELRCGPHLVILDAGTGLRRLGAALSGAALSGAAAPVDASILLSHTHLDHICGLGFFQPLYQRSTRLRLYGGHLPQDALRSALEAVLTPPLAPDLLRAARADLTVTAFAAGQTLAPQPGLAVETAPLAHPGGATGYRIAWGGRAIAYITDTEHEPGRPDANVLHLARDADVMIYDANYTDEELPARRGWGHSTWQEAVRLASAANVRRLVLFHHDSGRTDDDLDRIAAAAGAMRDGTVMAFDGMDIVL